MDAADIEFYTNCLRGPAITTDTPKTTDDFNYYFGWCYPTLIEDGYVAPNP